MLIFRTSHNATVIVFPQESHLAEFQTVCPGARACIPMIGNPEGGYEVSLFELLKAGPKLYDGISIKLIKPQIEFPLQ